jgi:threonylcarbamoyladenosine tRNA methylthiotransferase MtaB
MNVYFQAIGCRQNDAELRHWESGFRAAGLRITRRAEEADLMIFNSCAVTAEAVRKSGQMIRRLHRANPAARMVVSGCHASLEPERVAAELGVDLVIRNTDKDQLVDIALEHLNLAARPGGDMDEASPQERGRQRAFVKVQDGCRYRCSYCIITTARGAERSRPVAEVVDEANRLVAAGYREIAITGIQLGGYGNGIGSSLPELLDALLRDTDLARIRLGSLEPWAVQDGVVELFENPRLLPHLHLPLQSGCDSVLRRMARPTRTEEYSDLAERLRSVVRGFNLTTDIIAGFPGETVDEWRCTVDYVESVGFGHIHVFPYSDRSGTKAASLPDKIPPETKKARVREMNALATRMRREYMNSLIGTEQEILWEGGRQLRQGWKWRFFGDTPSFCRVAVDVPMDTELENEITRVHLRELDESGDFILATPV